MPDWLRNLGAYTLQMAVLVAAGALAAAAARVRRPRVMLAYWQALLLVALLLPALQPWRTRAAEGTPVQVAWSASTAAAAAPASLPWAEALAAVLLAGVLVRAWILARGLRRLAGLRRRALPWDDPVLLAEIQGLWGPPAQFLLSGEVQIPATFGLCRPVVVLPAAFAQLPREQQRYALCHELWHVRRRDWAWAVVEEALRAAFWFHPAVAWLVGRIRLAREQVVDAEVVRATHARQAYLETLLALARASAGALPAPLAMFLRESHLMRRVDLLLEEVAMSTTRVMLRVAASAAVVIGAGAVAVWAFPLHQEQEVVEKASVAGGVAGGVEGGVPGGVEGGVPGGVVGGVSGGVPGEKRKLGPRRKMVHRPPLVYPLDLKEQGIEGAVELEVKIEADGSVSDVRVLNGHAGLAEAAAAWAREARYEPFKAATLSHMRVVFRTEKDREKPE
jgi:TonB family protein